MSLVITIAAAKETANEHDYEWCARLMSSNEPWITLGRGLEGCRAALRRPGTELFVAREDQHPVGFLLLADYGLAGSPYIASIAVDEAARGRGVGSQMLRFAEERYAGRRHLFLLVSDFNPRARHLYERHGYELIGELKDYAVPGRSELLMHKRLE